MNHSVAHDSETPAPGQQVITACAFIHHTIDGLEKVFLPKRSATRKFLPDVFELPGGHINFGEDLITGLKRELREEVEGEIKVGDAFYAFNYYNDVKKSHSVEVIFFATFITPIDKIKLHPDGHSTYDWFGEDEMDTVAKNKGQNDLELQGILKGFALLKGTPMNFGK